jgi:hypothetical protein
MKKRLTGKERVAKYAWGSGDPIPAKPKPKRIITSDPVPGVVPPEATVNYDARRLKNAKIDQDALVADRIGELIGQDYDPFSSKGRIILNELSTKYYNPQFSQDLGTRLTVLRQDPFYSKLTPQQKVTHFFGTGTGKSELDKYLTRAKGIAGSPAAYFSGNPAMATGGEAGAMGGGDMGYGAMAQLLPQLGNAIMALTEKPSYTNQPIMNAQTAKNMTSPYAFGGELSDIDDEQFKLYLQAMFMNQLDAEEEDEDNYDILSEGIDEEVEEDDTENAFAMGGKAKGKKKIYIKPSKRGTFTAAAKKHGKSVQGFASQVLANKGNYSTAMVKKANFAKNASKWKHAYGGDIYAAMGYYAQGGNTNIEVEGDEIVQTPDGQMQKMSGPSHEQGGIDMNVPDGTKIYSDRLELEGKTMQQRKLNREKRLAKAAKTFKASPSDAIARNTLERTQEVVGREEQQDMALQKIANKIYAAPKQGQKQAAYGDEIGDPWSDYLMSQMPEANTQIPFLPGADTSQVPAYGDVLSGSATGRGINVNTPYVTGRTATDIGLGTPDANSAFNVPEIPQEEPEYGNVAGLTTGDYIGLGANLFNAIAPIVNTRNAARATKPEVNRFKGFGRQALEANAKAQGFAGVQAANAKRELDTAAGTATLRNRLGARSVNTMRALDTATDISRNKAVGSVNAQYTNQLTSLLGQEAQLANQRDQMEMSGATARDEREAQNIDNYYSNMAENLTNFGSNVGNIGRSLNQSRGNKDNAALLAAMSEYFDFGRKDGKLVLKNKGR